MSSSFAKSFSFLTVYLALNLVRDRRHVQMVREIRNEIAILHTGLRLEFAPIIKKISALEFPSLVLQPEYPVHERPRII